MCSKDLLFARHGTTVIGLGKINADTLVTAVNDNVGVRGDFINDNHEAATMAA